jgi:thioester reductase-like protein
VSEYTLLTGATGLLGRYLLHDLLLAGRRVAVVVRRSGNASGRERVERVLQRWESQNGCALPRPVCFEGDVSEPFLGLDGDARAWISEHCRSLLHSAATLTFEEDASGEPWRTNVGGTKNVIDFCQATGIRELHYVSTAYVCGLRQDLVYEDQLDCGQGFRNDYEKSKLVAEKLVRSAECLDDVTVYRPAVIAGDSVTGYTNTYHGLYHYLKLMSVIVWNTEPGSDGVRYTPVRLDWTGNEQRNIVPVDWVSTVICHLIDTADAHGHTFHLTPTDPITPREIIEAGYKYFNSAGVEFAGATNVDHGAISAMDKNAHDNMAVYRSYEVSDPRFDASNLEEFAAGMLCPRLDESMLHRYWQYGEQDRWGKRREKAPDTVFDADALLSRLTKDHSTSSFTGVVSLDVVGPGGGQWSLLRNSSRHLTLKAGLSANAPLIELPSSELIRRFETDELAEVWDWLCDQAELQSATNRSRAQQPVT